MSALMYTRQKIKKESSWFTLVTITLVNTFPAGSCLFISTSLFPLRVPALLFTQFMTHGHTVSLFSHHSSYSLCAECRLLYCCTSLSETSREMKRERELNYDLKDRGVCSIISMCATIVHLFSFFRNASGSLWNCTLVLKSFLFLRCQVWQVCK